MNPTRIEHARAHIASLRDRLHDIGKLLNAAAEGRGESSVPNSLAIAVRAIQAVSDDLAAVCDEQLAGNTDWLFEQAKAAAARSEVDSNEFDAEA